MNQVKFTVKKKVRIIKKVYNSPVSAYLRIYVSRTARESGSTGSIFARGSEGISLPPSKLSTAFLSCNLYLSIPWFTLALYSLRLIMLQAYNLLLDDTLSCNTLAHLHTGVKVYHILWSNLEQPLFVVYAQCTHPISCSRVAPGAQYLVAYM